MLPAHDVTVPVVPVNMPLMKSRLVLTALLIVLSSGGQGSLRAQPAPAASAPFVVERAMWVKPGRMVQFMTLFDRVERPKLESLRKDGRILWYRLSQPLLAGENEAWDLRLTIAWRDASTAAEKLDARASGSRVNTEHALLEELIVDQRETWVRETVFAAPGE